MNIIRDPVGNIHKRERSQYLHMTSSLLIVLQLPEVIMLKIISRKKCPVFCLVVSIANLIIYLKLIRCLKRTRNTAYDMTLRPHMTIYR